jgi:predicted transcriptional regulator
MGKRININLSDQAYEALEKLAEDKGKTMSETLRDALALEKWVQDAQRRGERLLVEKHGKTREIVTR